MPAGMLPEYPSSPGFKKQVIINIAGPASYTQVVTGSPPTGGQVITAANIGLVDIDYVTTSDSDDGQYETNPIFPSNPVTPVASIIVIWTIAATGAQVGGATNLSARTFRLQAVGHGG